MGQNGCARGVKSGIVVGVIEVPVSVDDEFQRGIAEAIESLFEFPRGGRSECVHYEFAVGSIQDNDVSAGTREQREIVSELLRLNGNGSRAGASGGDWVGGRGRRLLRVP